MKLFVTVLIIRYFEASIYTMAVYQSVALQLFEFNNLNIPAYSNYLIYLTQVSQVYSEALLLANSVSAPVVNTSSIMSTFQDYSSYISLSSHHFLSLNTSENWYLGIFINTFSDTVIWNLTIEGLNDFSCQNCAANSFCTNNECKCDQNWIGNDCSIKITSIVLSTHYVYVSKGYSYFCANFSSLITCSIQSNNSILVYVKKIENGYFLSSDLEVTGRLDHDFMYDFVNHSSNAQISVNSPSMVGIYSPYAATSNDLICMNASVSLKNVSNSSPYIAIFTSTGFVTILIIMWVTHRLKNAYKKKLHQKQIQHSKEFDPSIKNYKDLKSENYDTCVICLEKFKPDSQIRVLNCSHIFHRTCIDSWLSSTNFCPVCKKHSFKPCLSTTQVLNY